MSEDRPTSEQCELLKKGYERYKNNGLRQLQSLSPGTFDSGHFAHLIFGINKLGYEYYSKCDPENWDKVTALGNIADIAVKLIEDNATAKIQEKIANALKNVSKQLEDISGVDLSKIIENKKNAMIKEFKKL